jgi:thiol-disulfide isomerase/thioredoxin
MVILNVLMLLVAVAVLLGSAMGAFWGMHAFPGMFGLAWAALALLTLLVAWRRSTRPRLILVALTVLFAMASPLGQRIHERRHFLGLEQEQLAALRGRPAPALAFTHSFNLAPGTELDDYRGRLTVINFWATWCEPCREEIPLLEAFTHSPEGSRVQVIGFTRLQGSSGTQAPADELKRIRTFLEEQGATYPVLVSTNDKTHEAFGVRELPTTVLIDEDGLPVAYGAGAYGAQRVLGQAANLAAGPTPSRDLQEPAARR